jgi:imidazolonepropionase-like amidohydrolase
MKSPKNKCLFFALAALTILPGILTADVGPTYAIRNCRIVSMAGPVVEKGTIVIRDGLVESLGPADKIKLPEDAEIIEAEGLTAYPGLISAHTNLFIEIPQAQAEPSPFEFGPEAQQPPQEDKYPPGPGLMVYDQLKPKRTAMESFHKAGITAVLVAPARGIFQGQSLLLSLNGEKLEPMVVKNPFALHINFTTERRAYPSSLMGTIAHIRQSFMDAEYYAARKAQYEKILIGMKRPEYDPRLEALIPFVKDKRPVVFQCNNLEDIKRALRIIDEFKLNALLSGANEAWRVADVLKNTTVPLLVTLDFRPPMTSQYSSQGEELRKKAEAEIYPANAAALAKAGLRFALTSFGLADGAAFTKNVLAAIKAGLPRDEAIRALTVQPARTLGLDRQLGTLEPGKIANVVLTRGELFGEKMQTVKVFVDGLLFNYEERSR